MPTLWPTEPRKQAAWLKAARIIAACRDRYRITDGQHLLGPNPQDANVKQKIDATARGQPWNKHEC